MPKPPEAFAKEILQAVLVDGVQGIHGLSAMIRDRDFQLMTSTNDKIGGTD